MKIKNVGVGKFTLTQLSFNKNEGKVMQDETTGDFGLNFSDQNEENVCEASLELNLSTGEYQLKLSLFVHLKLVSDEIIKSQKELDKDELNLLFQPLINKASEIISYVTGNAMPFPEILLLDLNEIEVPTLKE